MRPTTGPKAARSARLAAKLPEIPGRGRLGRLRCRSRARWTGGSAPRATRARRSPCGRA